MSEIFFLDLDYALSKPELAVIDKENPMNVVMRINGADEPLISSTWKKYNLEVNYNGKTFWLSPDFLKSLKRRVSSITLNRIGITYRNLSDDEIEENGKLTSLISKLKKFKDTGIPIVILSSLETKSKSDDSIKKLISTNLRLPVIKEYNISNMDINSSADAIVYRKAKIVLEHLIGFKIRNNRFVDLKQGKYSKVKLFDTDEKCIEGVKNLQLLFELCLYNTDKTIKHKILERFKNSILEWETFLITNNDINPFIRTFGNLVSPANVDLFNSFK